MQNKPPFCARVGNRTYAERQKKQILLVSDTRSPLKFPARPVKPFSDPPKQKIKNTVQCVVKNLKDKV